MKRCLVLGSEGQVGWELQRTLMPFGIVQGWDRIHLDLCDKAAVRHAVMRWHPDVIINAAAYTAVDQAEEENTAAWQMNSSVPGFLASLAAELGALFVHYSTDYIFDGSSTTPYLEASPTGPLSTYGASKLEGEEAVRRNTAAHLILRTSWVYGARGKNFLLTMLKLGAMRDELCVVADQYGAPTWARFLAEATAHAVGKFFHTSDSSLYGTYHLTCSGCTTWHGFASAIFEKAAEIAPLRGIEPPHIPTVKAITTAEYPTLAERPRYSALDTSKFCETFGLSAISWQQALELCLHELFASHSSLMTGAVR